MSSTNKQLQQTIDIVLRDNERLINSNKELEKKIYDLQYADGVVECEMKAEILRLKADKQIIAKENKDLWDLVGKLKAEIAELRLSYSLAKKAMKDNWMDAGIVDNATNDEINDLKEERDHYMKMAQETADLKEEVKKLKVSNQLLENENNQLRKNDSLNHELRITTLESRIKELEGKVNNPFNIQPWITPPPIYPNNPITYENPGPNWNEVTCQDRKAPEPF